MNEKTEAAPPKGLDEAAGDIGLPAPVEPPGVPVKPVRQRKPRAPRRGANLKGKDLRSIEDLLPEQLAGCVLTKAKLPDEIAKFPALGQVAAISSEARKIFILLLAACVYSWLVIGTTTDIALIVNTASSPLPIINTPIPIADFYWVGPTILAAVYCYLHLYLLRLWRMLATLPAVFPDGVALDDKTDPWLLTGLVRTYMPRIPARPLGYVENGIAALLAWLLVPLTLFFYWRGLLPSHDLNRLAVLAFLIAFTTIIGSHTFLFARATLRMQVQPGDRARTLLSGIWRDFHFSRGQIAAFCLLAGTIMVLSIIALNQSPRDNDTGTVVVFSLSSPWESLREVDPTPAKLMNFLGIRSYADLREAAFAVRPEGWTGKELDKVKQVDLRNVNLAFADATRAFFAGADLRGSNLTGAILENADLRGTVFYDADRERPAQLRGANLSGAQMEGADLFSAQLQGANLSAAQLQGANLTWADMEGADLQGAQLQGATLGMAQLQGANLSWAGLQGVNLGAVALFTGGQRPSTGLQFTSPADLSAGVSALVQVMQAGAQLEGAVLKGAALQGANLASAQLQGADLRGSQLWRASLGSGERWVLADLRGSTVQPMPDSQIEALISEATKSIPDEVRRKRVAQTLNMALRTSQHSARPELPEAWRSAPKVMFNKDDPEPEPFDWGRRPTEEAYDESLGSFLGALACKLEEAATLGLARRALRAEPGRLWPRFFGARLTGPDCPRGQALPDDMRSELEQLAAGGDTSAVAPKISPP